MAAILVVSFFLKELADRVKVPFIVLLVIGGTILATYSVVSIKTLDPFPEMIRTLALIMVVFSSAFHLNIEELKRHSKSILLLSTLGVVLTTLLIAATTLYLLPISFIAAALLGVLLSGTDAAAISTAIPEQASEVFQTLRAESLFNSPFAVILPLLLLDFIKIPEEALLNVPKLFLLITIGIVVGSAGGALGKKLLEQTKLKHIETLALAIAIATYVIAENILGSGILAVAVCSIILNTGKYESKDFLGEFNSELAFISTLFVFMLLGAQFKIHELVVDRFEIIAIIISLLVARMITSFVVLFHSEFNLKDRIRIGLIAPKGVSPAALAPLVLIPSYGIIGADFVVKITYIAIVVSTLVSLVVAKVTEEPKSEEDMLKEQLAEKSKARETKKLANAKQ